MRVGGGPAKGSAFERKICKALSLWVTGGKQPDIFWRTAMSGGRSTMVEGVRQAGDLCAVEEEGMSFCRQWCVECKHVKDVNLDSFFVKRTGLLYRFWRKAMKDAERVGRDPMLIFLQNRWPILVMSRLNHVAHWAQPILTNGMVDVTLFSAMTRRDYA